MCSRRAVSPGPRPGPAPLLRSEELLPRRPGPLGDPIEARVEQIGIRVPPQRRRPMPEPPPDRLDRRTRLDRERRRRVPQIVDPKIVPPGRVECGLPPPLTVRVLRRLPQMIAGPRDEQHVVPAELVVRHVL